MTGQPGEVDVLDAVQDALDHAQAADLAGREVHLGHVAGHHHLRPEAQPGEEHLHLLGRGVLRLVQDDERVIQRSTAHVRQGGDLDGAGGHQAGDGVGVEHVVQRVVERAQVGVDLLVQGAGQEAQALPRLDRGPGQDDPVDLLGLQGLDRLGHGQVGLPGAGRADGEHDRVLVDGVRVALLVQRLGPDGPAAGGQDADGQHVGRAHAALGAQHGRGPLHRVGGQVGALAQQLEELVEQVGDQSGLRRVAGRGDLVAADVDVGVELALDHVQELVAGSEQADHGMVSRDHDLHLGSRFTLAVGTRLALGFTRS